MDTRGHLRPRPGVDQFQMMKDKEMARAKWISHKGKRVLWIDFSKTDDNGVIKAIAEAKPIIIREPNNSILCIVDATGTKVTRTISAEIKEFTMHNKPFMKMTAVIGIDGIQKVVLTLAIIFTNRKNLIAKNTKDEALEWLISQ